MDITAADEAATAIAAIAAVMQWNLSLDETLDGEAMKQDTDVNSTSAYGTSLSLKTIPDYVITF